MLFFSFFSFERERVLFSLVGTEKKTPLWKERDLERETRRDCLKYDVIVFFLDNTIAVVSPINRIFSHKRHFKNHFDCEAKKATRAVLVPKADNRGLSVLAMGP